MTHDDCLKRFDSAVEDINNFHTNDERLGWYELPERIKLDGEMEICGVDISGAGCYSEREIIITPNTDIWRDAYFQHRFRFPVDALSDSVIQQICEALEAEVKACAAWWDIEE